MESASDDSTSTQSTFPLSPTDTVSDEVICSNDHSVSHRYQDHSSLDCFSDCTGNLSLKCNDISTVFEFSENLMMVYWLALQVPQAWNRILYIMETRNVV